MKDSVLRRTAHLIIGVVIAAVLIHTWVAIGLLAPVIVAGSSMAPALVGEHRNFHCDDCGLRFSVGLDQLPPDELAICPGCDRRGASSIEMKNRAGARLRVDRTAILWRGPRRWEPIVFRCPERAGELCVKRVVGLPGETVSLVDGDVWIDGRIVRKTLAEQRAVRLPVEPRGDDSKLGARTTMVLGNEWSETLRVDRITDELSYNQGAMPPVNRVADVMLTFNAQLKGAGELMIAATGEGARWEAAIDFARGEAQLRRDDQLVVNRRLPPAAIGRVPAGECTFSLFDQQVLVATGDDVLLCEAFVPDKTWDPAAGVMFSLRTRGLKGTMDALAVWRDGYYAVRHGDGRQTGAKRGELGGKATASWRLGPAEYFVVGDNAAISDDSRSWPAGAGVDAKLLIGKPLGVR